VLFDPPLSFKCLVAHRFAGILLVAIKVRRANLRCCPIGAVIAAIGSTLLRSKGIIRPVQ
jgi:hypothetical protein